MQIETKAIRPNTYGFLRNLTDNPCPCKNCGCGLNAHLNGREAVVTAVLSDGALIVRCFANSTFLENLHPDNFEPNREAYFCEGSIVEPLWDGDSATIAEPCEHGDCFESPKPAIGQVHVELPVDGGMCGISASGEVVQLRPPAPTSGYYHMAMCREHFDAFVAAYPNEVCRCKPDQMKDLEECSRRNGPAAPPSGPITDEDIPF